LKTEIEELKNGNVKKNRQEAEESDINERKKINWQREKWEEV
jgi:hypothetical protein